MLPLMMVLLASPVTSPAKKTEPVPLLCLTLVLERDRYWFAATGHALEPAPYPSLADKVTEINRSFPGNSEVLVAPASDVPIEWAQDALVLLRERGLRRFAITDGALAAAAKKAPLADWIKDMKWVDATLVPIVRSQCQAKLKAKAFQDDAPRLLPSTPPAVASRAKATSQDALTGITMCGAAARVPSDLSMGVLASQCSRVASCAGSCAQALMSMTRPDGPFEVCPEFTEFQKGCSPVYARACRSRFTLSMVRGFVEVAKALPEGPDLEQTCAPLLAP